MSLQYRLIAEDDRADVADAAARAFSVWIRDQKSFDLDVTAPGRWSPTDGVEVVHERFGDDEVGASRFVLHEESSSARWSTTLTAMRGDGTSWLWLDVEWVSESPWGQAPVVKPPRLAQYLLVDGTVHQGPVVLPPAHFVVETAEQARTVAALATQPERPSPIVLLSHDSRASAQQQQDRARFLARELTGVAPLYLLGQDASAEFNRSMPDDLSVFAGAARTYMPDRSPLAGSLGRHRVMGSRWFEVDPRSAATRLARPLVTRALAARPPELYRDRLRPMMRQHDGAEQDVELLLAQTIAAEERADTARQEAAALRFDRDFEVEEHAESQAELDSALARVRWLESELDKARVHTAGVATPEEFEVEEVESFRQLLDEARTRLPRLRLGDTDDTAVALDGWPASTVWARRTWRALRALQSFADAKANGWRGDFMMWCKSSASGGETIPSGWVSMVESETVENNAGYRAAREFPVPKEANDAERVFMCAHVKIVPGGRPAPRVHFFDSIDKDGKVHIGYIGQHLPNDQTN
ncbi:hypothetical protein QUG98_04405 [Curtobacterium sp. RHCJP20]|uniref:Uncharacterized protein n=1 Tax=Curtobacterium subtropicum TaxID=3055138 RepID=A0ABT7TDP7_9MICO|nr:hypothetical protein [Curtobacterium subtropicum]MDM7887690.1 hypothetical protein [Curtobacterium subtropicum]